MNYRTTLKTTRLNAVITDIGASGELIIGTSGMATVLATISLADPAGTVSGDTLTFTMPQSDASADAGGTPLEAIITDGSSTIIDGISVGVSASDIIIDAATVTAGQEFKVSSGTIVHA